MAVLPMAVGCQDPRPADRASAPLPAFHEPAAPVEAPQARTIHFKELTPFAPDQLLEWTGGKLTASTSRFRQVEVTEILRAYSWGGRTASVRLVDTTLNDGARGPELGERFEDERRAGEPIRLQAAQGWAELEKESGKASANLIVAERVVVTLECDGAKSLDEVERMAAAMDLAGLARAARRGEAAP